ncbi:MAG: type IV pilus twitching motility protein PilT [Armatimonadota bacterium]|nr:type IV pilus twitching motility protein PilT [Armatimonadota bacterium]MDR7444784.1 type IV pilus twitching motility protein PilT [Armatimonadota bacterium]MDR7569215.1 type IV pilus twitching motility protein PilT [Armatimonadota bacterium]MDR7613333.1 type IV pilus twitching motility protein PilT [Armatimonadota bacterium]
MDITDLLVLARERDASDLHLTVGSPPRLRLRGELVDVEGWPPITREELHAMLYDILTDAQKAQFEEHLDLDFALELQSLGRFRVNIFHQRTGEGAAFRVIPSRIRSLEELGLPPVLRELALREHGLILVTGPAGSGKSTTLAAMVDLINATRRVHIITIEDPIEFVHPHRKALINQREVGVHAKSFSAALRAALREDPDVILVGEMRDLETIALALTAAETGHLVLATLHTSSAAQTIHRIIDVFPSHQQEQIRVQLAETLVAVVAQVLLPTADGLGRVPAVEVMVATPAVRNLIRESKVHQIPSVIQTGLREGMQSMDQSLRHLVKTGKVTPEVAVRWATEKQAFARPGLGAAPPAQSAWK